MDLYQFPKGFLWGAATAAHQVEGNNANNDWTEWEKVPGHIHDGTTSQIACDWWGGRYREDFDLARTWGHNAHRLSIEWSRLQPTPDTWDDHAFDYYRQVLGALRERGMTPFVTLDHFSKPRWFLDQGGWLNDAAPNTFMQFATHAVECLGDLAEYWCTLNEPNLYVLLSYLWGSRPPQAANAGQAFRVARNQMLGHAAAFHAIHRVQKTAKVGLAHAWRAIAPQNPGSRADRLCAWVLDRIFNRMVLRAVTDGVFIVPMGRGERIPEAKNTLDYFGMNYYFKHPVAFDAHQPAPMYYRMIPSDDLQGTNYASWFGMGKISTAAFVRVLREASAFHVPIYITENGIFDAGGDIQERYLVTHLNALRQAIRAGVDVRGYFWWTLVDNFEWDAGFWLRFGLAHLDVETQVRTPRPSAALMARIIAENGIADDLLNKYGGSLQ